MKLKIPSIQCVLGDDGPSLMAMIFSIITNFHQFHVKVYSLSDRIFQLSNFSTKMSALMCFPSFSLPFPLNLSFFDHSLCYLSPPRLLHYHFLCLMESIWKQYTKITSIQTQRNVIDRSLITTTSDWCVFGYFLVFSFCLENYSTEIRVEKHTMNMHVEIFFSNVSFSSQSIDLEA